MKYGGWVSGMPAHLVTSGNKRKNSLQGLIRSYRLSIEELTGFFTVQTTVELVQ